MPPPPKKKKKKKKERKKRRYFSRLRDTDAFIINRCHCFLSLMVHIFAFHQIVRSNTLFFSNHGLICIQLFCIHKPPNVLCIKLWIKLIIIWMRHKHFFHDLICFNSTCKYFSEKSVVKLPIILFRSQLEKFDSAAKVKLFWKRLKDLWIIRHERIT